MNEELNELRQASEELDEFFGRIKVLNSDSVKLTESLKSRTDDKEYIISIRPTLGHSYKEVCKLNDEWKDYCIRWHHLMDKDMYVVINHATDTIENFKDIIASILRLSLKV